MISKTKDEVLNELLQHEVIKPLKLNKTEANTYAAVIEQMVREFEACKAAPTNECPNGNHMHLILYRDENKKLHISAEICSKMARREKISNNYLTNTFGKQEYDYKLNQETFGKTSAELRGKGKLITLLTKLVKSGEINSGLYIYGETGRGKTFAMKAFCNEVANKLNKTVAYFLIPDLITQ